MRLALIGARAGSKRFPGKNFKPLGGRPLISWTIDAARESGLFDLIAVCSDSLEVLSLAESPVICHHRKPSSDTERDVEWVSEALRSLKASPEDEVWLLRPTSPFRGPQTLLRACEQWDACKYLIDSLRAMRKATEHPYKAFVVEDYISPNPNWKHLGVSKDGTVGVVAESVGFPAYPTAVPITTAAAKKKLYEYPTQSLTDAYIQTSGLEIFRARLPLEEANLSGDQIGMFLVEGAEALDINDENDWAQAEREVRGRTMQEATK